MGQHQRVCRRRSGQPGVRLDYSRSDFRHLPETRTETLRANWFHAEGALDQTGALSTSLDANSQVRRDLYRLVISAQRLQEVGRTCLPVGEALCGALWSQRSRVVVLG